MTGIDVYLSLGSNLGDKEANLCAAISLLESKTGVGCAAVSDFIKTESWGFSSENIFLNAAARFTIPDAGQDADLYSLALLRICKEIEHSMGRTGKPEYASDGSRIYRDRVIDIDILFYGKHRMESEELTIPHKGIRDRDFVMIPLLQVAKEDIKEAFPDIFTAN